MFFVYVLLSTVFSMHHKQLWNKISKRDVGQCDRYPTLLFSKHHNKVLISLGVLKSTLKVNLRRDVGLPPHLRNRRAIFISVLAHLQSNCLKYGQQLTLLPKILFRLQNALQIVGLEYYLSTIRLSFGSMFHECGSRSTSLN